MINKSNCKTPMSYQDAVKRASNFEEVALGYTEEEAVTEAERCLNCKDPQCMKGCPVCVRIPDFITAVRNREFSSANAIIKETNSLPAICGRVCPQESQCEKNCVRGKNGEPVAIGRLERFVSGYGTETDSLPVSNGHKVAIIGSGPSGLSCAGDLAKNGFDVTVYEALHVAGGVLVYGIPEFRLPKTVVSKEIDNLKKLGVKIETNVIIGKTLTIEELFSMGYEAVYIGSGAGLPNFMGIPGENLNGVYSANEFLTRINLMKAYRDDSETPVMSSRTVAVVGGGNVAMDAARSALRLGAEHVYIVYRRGENELPARKEEVEHAKEEGIEFRLLTNPVGIIGNDAGNVTGIECVKMELGEPDQSGRRSPVEVQGSNFIIEVECVIMAIGTSPNPLLSRTTDGLETGKRGVIQTDDSEMTSIPGVFAGGDAVTGAATVILAMGAGKKAAVSISDYILNRK